MGSLPDSDVIGVVAMRMAEFLMKADLESYLSKR